MNDKNIRNRLADRIRQLRHEQQLTQEKLAQSAGLSLYYIQVLESKKAKKNATIVTVAKIAHAFGMEPWELLKFR